MHPRLLVPALLILTILPIRADAQSSLTWGPNQSGDPAGGNGSWSITAANWTPDNGASYQAWPSAASTVAVFSGTAGTVSLSGALSAGGLTFGASGYTINATAGSGLTLGNDPFGFPPQIIFTNPAQIATINAPLAGSGGVYLGGGGTLVLGGANTLTGTISLARTGLTVLSATGSLNGNDLAMGNTIFASGGGGAFTLDNTGATGASAQTLGTLFLYGGDATITTNRVAAQSLSLTLASQQRTVGATVNYVVAGGVNGTNNRISLAGVGFLDRGTFFGGNNFAWRDSGGYLRAIQYGTGGDTGAVTTTNPTTNSLTGTHVQVAGNVTAQASTTFSTLKLSTAGNVALAGGATLVVGGILKADGGSSIISGGTAIRANSGADLVIRTDTAADTLTISSAITNNGGSSLTKTGLGTLVLSGTNTYSGGTYLNAGTLSVATLPTGTGNSSIGTGALNFSGGTLQYTGATASTTRRINFLPGGGGIEVTSSNAVLTLSSQINGANTGLAGDALVKTGAGTLVLAGGNNTDNSGLTLVVNAGTVQLAKTNANAHAVSGLFINNGGTVQLAGSGGDQIYDGSAVAVNTGGRLDLNGRNEGFDTLRGGGSITNNSSTASSTLTLGTNYDASTRATFSGVISDGTGGRTLALATVGYGTQILSGAHTYSGGTAITGGRLLVNGTGVAGISSGAGLGAVVVNGAGSLLGATLGGTGAIQGAVRVEDLAQITGGDAGTIGTLTLRSSLTFAGTGIDTLATYLVDIGAGNSDRLALVGLGAAGVLDLGGAFDQLAFSGAADGTSSYVLATYASLNGTFDNVLNLPANYALQYGATALSLVPTAVPEPATWAAGLLALGAFGYSQRRRLAQ